MPTAIAAAELVLRHVPIGSFGFAPASYQPIMPFGRAAGGQRRSVGGYAHRSCEVVATDCEPDLRHRNRIGFACGAVYCRLAPLFLSNTASIGPHRFGVPMRQILAVAAPMRPIHNLFTRRC